MLRFKYFCNICSGKLSLWQQSGSW